MATRTSGRSNKRHHATATSTTEETQDESSLVTPPPPKKPKKTALEIEIQKQQVNAATNVYEKEIERLSGNNVSKQFNKTLLQRFPGVSLDSIRSLHRRRVAKRMKDATRTASAAAAAAATATPPAPASDTSQAVAEQSTQTTGNTTTGDTTTGGTTAGGTTTGGTTAGGTTAGMASDTAKENQPPPPPNQQAPPPIQRNKGGRQKGDTKENREKQTKAEADATTEVVQRYKAKKEKHSGHLPKGTLAAITEEVAKKYGLDTTFSVHFNTIASRIATNNLDGSKTQSPLLPLEPLLVAMILDTERHGEPLDKKSSLKSQCP